MRKSQSRDAIDDRSFSGLRVTDMKKKNDKLKLKVEKQKQHAETSLASALEFERKYNQSEDGKRQLLDKFGEMDPVVGEEGS